LFDRRLFHGLRRQKVDRILFGRKTIDYSPADPKGHAPPP